MPFTDIDTINIGTLGLDSDVEVKETVNSNIGESSSNISTNIPNIDIFSLYKVLRDEVSNGLGKFIDSEGRNKSDYRKYCRIMHGSNANNDDVNNVTSCSPNSPLDNLLKNNQDAKINVNGTIITVSAKEISKYQNDVKLYYNANAISKQEVIKVQQYKEKITTGHFADKDLNLESKASYLLIRGFVTEYITSDGKLITNSQGKPETLERVVYYSCFPKLLTGTADFFKYCDFNGNIIDGIGLKQKFKNILEMQIKIAEKHKEALDIVTPNAFFAGLKNKNDGKNLFLEAIKETAESINVSKNFKGLFIHGHGFTDQQNFKFSVLTNPGDAGTPAKIAKEQNYNFTVATCIMGEALGAAGNGAFGKYGNKAMEEDLTRRSFGAIAWVFGSQFNKNLLNSNNYEDISSELSTESTLEAIGDISLNQNDGKVQKFGYYKDALQFTFATPKDAQEFHKTFPNITQVGKSQTTNVYIKDSKNKSAGVFNYKGYTYINCNGKADILKQYLPNGTSAKITAQNTLSIGKTENLKIQHN